jgi:hypothetical protein
VLTPDTLQDHPKRRKHSIDATGDGLADLGMVTSDVVNFGRPTEARGCLAPELI